MENINNTHEVMNKKGILAFRAQGSPSVRLTALGDMAFHDIVLNGDPLADVDKSVFSCVEKSLKGADILLGNLETVISKNPEIKFPHKACRVTDLRAVNSLRSVNIELVSFANNHIKDMGNEGFIETAQHLNSAEIKVVGAGVNSSEARKPVIIYKKGLKFRFFAYSYSCGQIAKNDRPGCREANYNDIVEDLTLYADDCNFTVVSLHMDAEFQSFPSPSRIKLCRKLADYGVDIILCHHPHVLQGIENWNGSLIAYSLGNYVGQITEYMKKNSSDCNKSYHLNIDICEKGIINAHIYPILINDFGRPEIPSERVSDNILLLNEERSMALSDIEFIKKAYRKMLSRWVTYNLKTIYWALRKLEFSIVYNIFYDLFKTKMKKKWLFDYLFLRY